MSLYHQQKKVRPKIEDVIGDFLDGEKLANAQDFIAFLRAGKMPPQWASANSWAVNFKNKRVCYIKVGDGFWYICHNGDHVSGYENNISSESLREFVWNNLYACTSCANCAPGGSRTVLGKEFNHICHGFPFRFYDPSAEELVRIYQLMEIRKNTIADGI